MTTTPLTSSDFPILRESVELLRAWRQEHQDLTVALVYGGVSAEDRLYIADSPVEQMTVTALAGALADLGLRFKVLDPCDPGFVAELARYDVVLSALHGPFGEDGRLQGLLDYLRLPYCGSGVTASAIAADKIQCKHTMAGLNIPTPPWQEWRDGSAVTWPGHPVMVKPSMGGSSVGMSLVWDASDLAAAVTRATSTDRSPVLGEAFVRGTPVTVGLLELPGGVLAFPPLATEVDAEFYDQTAKLDPTGRGAVSCLPAALPDKVLAEMTTYTRMLWDTLGCHGGIRVDYIVTEHGRVYALEVNTTPGMSRGSNFATGAHLCGLSHTDVVTAFLHEALTRPPYDVPLPTPDLTTRTPAPRSTMA